MIYFVAIIAGLAGILFGYDEGVIAGALLSLHQEFTISAFAEGVMTSAVPLGALFGALAAGPLAERHGRRTLLLAAATLFVAGAILAGLATGVWMLAACRLLLGFAVGVAGMVAPLYISESAPARSRGMLVSVYQLAITLGILGAYVMNYALEDAWRTMFMLGAVPGIVLFAGMLVLRDTPRWLAGKGRTDEARQALASLRGTSPDAPDIHAEVRAIQEASGQETQSARWSELLSPVVRPAFVVGIGLFFLQQLSGINAVIYYAPTVFREAGFDSSATQLLATMGVGAVNVLMTLVGMALIDRIGRRRLLFLGFAGTALGLGLIAVGAATGSASLDILAIVGLALYIGAFAASLGPLPWVMMSEVFPLRVRGLAMGVTSVSNWGFNFLVVFSFPLLVQGLGLAGVFGIYTVVCLAGLVFTLRYVPETSGLSLEAIEHHLRSGLPFRTLGESPASIVLVTDAPDISPERATALIAGVIRLSPHRQNLEALAADIGRVAYANVQVRCALRELNRRLGGTPPLAMGRQHLGAQAPTLHTFLEHIHFASPGFLQSVGEWPPRGTRG